MSNEQRKTGERRGGVGHAGVRRGGVRHAAVSDVVGVGRGVRCAVSDAVVSDMARDSCSLLTVHC
jgi:hypothetical protein